MRARHTQASLRDRAITPQALVNSASRKVVNIASTKIVNAKDREFHSHMPIFHRYCERSEAISP